MAAWHFLLSHGITLCVRREAGEYYLTEHLSSSVITAILMAFISLWRISTLSQHIAHSGARCFIFRDRRTLSLSFFISTRRYTRAYPSRLHIHQRLVRSDLSINIYYSALLQTFSCAVVSVASGRAVLAAGWQTVYRHSRLICLTLDLHIWKRRRLTRKGGGMRGAATW